MGGLKAVLTSAAKKVVLYREVFETKRNNAKLGDRNNNPERDLKDVRFVERLACVHLELALPNIKTLKAQVNNTGPKEAKMIDKMAQAKNYFQFCISSWESSLEMERDCGDKVVRDKTVFVNKPGEYDVMRRRLQERDEALMKVREKLIVVFSGLESLRCNAKDLEEMLSVPRTDMALQPLLREASRKQLDAKLMELKEVQSEFELRNEELITLFEQQTRATAELTQLFMQNVNETAEANKSESVMTERE